MKATLPISSPKSVALQKHVSIHLVIENLTTEQEIWDIRAHFKQMQFYTPLDSIQTKIWDTVKALRGSWKLRHSHEIALL